MGTVNGANNIQISTVFCQLKGEGKALNSAERKGCLSENALFILTSGFIMFIYYLLVVFTYRLLQSTVCVSPARQFRQEEHPGVPGLSLLKGYINRILQD